MLMLVETLPIHFAPLQGYTEAIYRNAHATVFGGVETYYTPFVRLEKETFRSRDIRDIEPGNNTVSHLIPQLIGADTNKAEAILSLFIEKGYKEVDINMGCPFPMLAKRHNGSGILPFPEEVEKLLEIIHKYPEINFSVKMRLGWENTKECLNLPNYKLTSDYDPKNTFDIEKYLNRKEKIHPGDEFIVVDADSLPSA